MVLVRLVDCIVPFLVLCRLCSGLRFGEFWLPCRVVFGCMLVWITLTSLIMSLVFLLVGVVASLFLWLMMVTCCLKYSNGSVGGRIDNAAVSKVKGHADEGLIASGRVREVDRIGNNEADAAAALGRRRAPCRYLQ